MEIAQNGGAYQAVAGNNATGAMLALADPSAGWQKARINLDDYANSTIQVRFRFQTIDNWLNDYPGFYVDNCIRPRQGRPGQDTTLHRFHLRLLAFDSFGVWREDAFHRTVTESVAPPAHRSHPLCALVPWR